MLSESNEILQTMPIFDGLTRYSDFKDSELTCPKGLGSENGPMPYLDTSMAGPDGFYRSFGSGSGSGSGLRNFRNLSRKRFGSRQGFGSVRRRSFGQTGSFGQIPEIYPLGLPEGSVSANTINETYPTLFTGGAPLPRPYGPRDNLELLSRFGKGPRPKPRPSGLGFGLGLRGRRGPRRSRKFGGLGQRRRSRNFGSMFGSGFGSMFGLGLGPTRRRRSRNFGLGLGGPSKPIRRSFRRSRNFGSDSITLPGPEDSMSTIPGPSNMTPGTPGWVQDLSRHDFSGQEYARPYLQDAKGSVAPTINYYNKPSNNAAEQNAMYNISNVPMQYSNNSMNTPLFKNNFGLRNTGFGSRNIQKPVRRRNFGAMTTTDAFTGPNQVAYNQPIPMYHGGSNTTNWQTKNAYLPEMVPGTILGVQSDNLTPNAFLGNSPTIDVVTSVPNTANAYTNRGLEKSSDFSGGLGLDLSGVSSGPGPIAKPAVSSGFGSKNIKNRRSFGQGSSSSGSSVYTPELVTAGTGDQVLYQGEPPYMAAKKDTVDGDFVGSGFGSRNENFGSRKRPALSAKKRSFGPKPNDTKPKKLTTHFGGATITLKEGNVFVN